MNEILHPTVFDWMIPLVLIPVAILQWILMVFLVARHGIARSLGHKLKSWPEAAGIHRTVPFLKDGFFALWNLLPIAAGIFYCMIWQNWSSWVLSFGRHFGAANIKASYGRWFPIDAESTTLLTAMFCAATWACVVQVSKQRSMIYASRRPGIQSNVAAYWWDWRISKAIFMWRLLALFVNMSAVVFYFVQAFRLIGFLTEVTATYEPVPVLLHPDGVAGFGFIGDICFWLAILLIFGTGMGLAGYFDHYGQGWWHFMTDTFVFVVSIGMGLWVLLVPAREINQGLAAKYAPVIENSTTITENLLTDLNRQIEQDPGAQKLDEWLQGNAATLLILRELHRTELNPLKADTVFWMFSTLILPLLTWVFFKLLDLTGAPAEH